MVLTINNIFLFNWLIFSYSNVPIVSIPKDIGQRSKGIGANTFSDLSQPESPRLVESADHRFVYLLSHFWQQPYEVEYIHLPLLHWPLRDYSKAKLQSFVDL